MNQIVAVVLIGLGGALGAWTRYATNIGMHKLFGHGILFGTLTVNIVGCFCLGVVAHLSEQHLSQQWKLVIGVGFLGALTTFSTFGLETVTRFNAGETLIAFGNVALNVVLGLSAVVLGMYLANVWSPAAETS